MEHLLHHASGFSLHHDRGRHFDLRFRGRSLLGPFSLSWAYGGEAASPLEFASTDHDVARIDTRSTDTEASLEYPIVNQVRPGVRLRLSRRGLEVRLTLGHLESDASMPVQVWFFTLVGKRLEDTYLSGLGQQAGWRFFPIAYSSFSPAFSRDSRTVLEVPPFPTASIFNQHHDSVYWGNWSDLSTPWMATLHRSGAPETLLVGFSEARIGLGEVAIRRRDPTWLEARVDFGGKQIGAGEALEGDPLLIWFSDDGDALIDAWTDEVAACMNARQPASTKVPSGWCSWYYYYTRVTEADVLENLEVLDIQRERLPIDYVQLDDGYQPFVGDWLDLNAKFPSGLEALTARIVKAGFRPGIWTAPFFVQRGSFIYRHHKDWLIRNHDGKPRWLGYLPTWGIVNGHLFGLDPTHPKVLDYLTDVYTTLVKYGFEYFKIDFLFAGLEPGRHHDPTRSPVEAFRLGLDRIRTAIGDRFLLGCGAPLLPCVGVVDGMRISPDVKEAWRDPIVGFLARGAGHPAAELAILNCLTRSHLHNKWWLNDPDCLLVREKRSRLELVEVQTLVTVLSLTGGMLFLSDDLAELSLPRRDLAELALPPGGTPARTLGLRDEARPSRYVRYHEGDGGRLEALAAIINWDDRKTERTLSPQELGMPDADYHTYDYWSRTYSRLPPGKNLHLALEPHETALMLLRPALDRPQLITATHHVGQTTVILREESWSEDGTLTVSLETNARREGQVLISVPEHFALEDIRAEGGAQLTGRSRFAKGLRLSVPLDDRGTLVLEFSRSTRGKSPGSAPSCRRIV